MQNFGRIAPREREVVFVTAVSREREGGFKSNNIIARSAATKQSILPCCGAMDCFASLAMTVS
jgi:hypothetical protein